MGIWQSEKARWHLKALLHMQQPPAVVGAAENMAGAAVSVGIASSLAVGGGVGAAAPLSAAPSADAPVTVPGCPNCTAKRLRRGHTGL